MTAATDRNEAAGPVRWRMLALVATAEILGMSAWFSASAVSPQLRLAEAAGWRWAFAVLALGPAFGIAAIQRLARLQRPQPTASAGS